MNKVHAQPPIRIRPDLYEWLQERAKADNRSTKMYLEVLLEAVREGSK